MQAAADPSGSFARHGIDYLLFGESTPLIVYIRAGWDCCTLLGELDGLVLYQVDRIAR